MFNLARLAPSVLPLLKKLAPLIILLGLILSILMAVERAENRGYKRCISETNSQTKLLFEEAYHEQTKTISNLPRDIDAVVDRLLKAEFNNNPN